MELQAALAPLTTRERARIIADLIRYGWAFTILPDGGIDAKPPISKHGDSFDLVDLRR